MKDHLADKTPAASFNISSSYRRTEPFFKGSAASNLSGIFYGGDTAQNSIKICGRAPNGVIRFIVSGSF